MRSKTKINMSNTLVFSGVSKKTLAIIAITIGVLFAALIGIRYAAAVAPSDYGLTEGNTVSAAGSDDPDVYIVNEQGYKRLFLNPVIFGFYGHLGGFANVKSITPATRDAFPTSGLFRLDGDQKVYGVESTGEDTGVLHWVNTSGAQAVADDPNFFKKVFVINQNEFNWYAKGTNYTSVSQVPNYVRAPGTPVVTGPLSVTLAPGNPAAQTITRNAAGLEMLRMNFTGTGTINTLTIKRQGAGVTADFGNVYVYAGATRLTSGKSFSSATGEATSLLDEAVSGSKELSIVVDMAAAAGVGSAVAGNVNYIQLVSASTGTASVSGAPLNGNNFTVSGAQGGTIDVSIVGSLSNPTVGQKQANISEFKIAANTEGASFKRLTLLQAGTLKPADLTNLKLKSGSREWSGTINSDSYIVFDLGSGFSITKGGNAIFDVYGDTGGKSTETLDIYFENDSDILAVGDQYGNGMAEKTNTMDTAAEVTDLTLQGGALTLVFNGPNASTVGTQVTDATLLRYSMTAVSNIEVKKTEFTLCDDNTGNGTYDSAIDQTLWDNVTDFKVSDEDTGIVVIGPKDGTDFDDADGECPDTVSGAQALFTDTLDLVAGKTYNFKVTADIDTSLGGTYAIASGIIKAVLDDYSDDAGITVMKYAGTNTAVLATDIVPRADISGPNITLSAAALTLSLSGTPADQTKIRGTKDVNVVGITFAAGQASALKVTKIKITGYAADTAGNTYDEGTPDDDADSGISVANAMSKVQLYESGGALIAGSDKVSNNALGTGGTGTMTFSDLNWNIPAGTSKTMLVKVDLSNNDASGTAGDLYAFDIAATTDVTALDVDSNTINPSAASVAPNGGLTPTQVLTVKNSGSMVLAASADTPAKGAIYWGQTSAPVSKFRLSSTDEAQYIEKLTIAASNSTENTHAKNNVKEVVLTYKNKAGSSVTKTQSFGNAASANFTWESTDVNRPYVPKDSSMDIAVNANMKISAEGATQTDSTDVYFSLDLVDKFNGSYTNGFRAVGEGSGTVLDGTSTNIVDVLGTNDMYVYRVFPKFAQLAYPANETYNLIGSPTVFRFSITAVGLTDSFLRFDNVAAGSGSIKFEIISSGTPAGGDSTVSTLDEDGTVLDTVALTNDADLATDASYTFDFGNSDVEIQGGATKNYTIRLDGTAKYTTPAAVGVGADYWQVVLNDTSASDTALVNWVGNYAGAATALDTASTAGVLKTLPLYGPVFTRQ